MTHASLDRLRKKIQKKMNTPTPSMKQSIKKATQAKGLHFETFLASSPSFIKASTPQQGALDFQKFAASPSLSNQQGLDFQTFLAATPSLSTQPRLTSKLAPKRSSRVSRRVSVSRKPRVSKVVMKSRKNVERRVLPKENQEKGENSFCNSLGEEECKRLSQKKTFPCRWVPSKGNRKAYCGIAVKEHTMGEGFRKKKSVSAKRSVKRSALKKSVKRTNRSKKSVRKYVRKSKK